MRMVVSIVRNPVWKSINCARLCEVARALHSNPGGFVWPEKKHTAVIMNIQVSKEKYFITSLGRKLSWRILSDMALKKSESFGQLGDQYMTKMNFLWRGRDILKTEN